MQLSIDPSSVPDASFQHGILRKNGQVWVGSHGDLRKRLIQEMHAIPWGGHSGILPTQHRLRSLFYWPSLLKDVKEMVRSCEICQRNKAESVPYPGLLQPLPIPTKAWEHVTMDFIDGLPKSQGKDTILVIVDKYTKYAHFLTLSHPYNATQVAQKFLDNVFKLHGAPCSVVSDRDPIFISNFWKEFLKGLQIQQKLSTAYHPQTDGQTERLNKCLETYLRCMTGHKPKEWCKLIPLAEFWYNTTHHSTIGMSPFKALYDYDPPQPTFELVS